MNILYIRIDSPNRNIMENRKTLLFSFLIFFVLILTTCKKNERGEMPGQKSFTELKVNESFHFQTTESVNVNITIGTKTDIDPYLVSIYTNDPLTGGKLLMKARTNEQLIYENMIKIPCWLKQIFVEVYSRQGVKQTTFIEKTENGFIHEFGQSNTKSSNSLNMSDPGCEDCDVLLSGTGNALIQPGIRYCVEEGASWDGLLKFYNGGELVICGTADIYLHPSTGGGTIYISDSGEVNMDDLYLKNNLLVENYGNLDVASVFTVAFGGRLENYGQINCQAITNYNNSSGILNEGELNPATFVNNLGELTNDGTISAGSYFSNNSTALLQNNCKIVTGLHFNQIGSLNIASGAYLQVDDLFDSWPSSNTQLADQGMIKTKDLEVEGTIAGPANGCARLEVTDNTEIKPAGSLTNNLDLCDENGIEINNGSIGPNVTNCLCYIPITDCNPVGAGDPPINDTDGDGVPDDQDDYPNDPDKAFNSYYPNQTDFGTMAFEDLWPNLGDYDFNDLVIEFQYQMVTNADNEYVDILGLFHIKAMGAGKDNGFGFVLEVAPGETETVTGTVVSGDAVSFNAKGFEDGHSYETVVFVYDAIRSMASWSMINTIHGGNTMEFDTVLITVNFASPQSAIGEPPYNPFIFIGQNRGKELHMVDHAPSSLANVQYFGADADASDPASGSYYKTGAHLPWAIEIPVSFDYPLEKIDILYAHLKFAEWATSGGNTYADWYLDSPGYRDEENIY